MLGEPPKKKESDSYALPPDAVWPPSAMPHPRTEARNAERDERLAAVNQQDSQSAEAVGTSSGPSAVRSGGFLHERMRPEDPNYELIKELELNTWTEWGWQLDGTFSRHAPIGKYLESATKTLERVFDLLITFHGRVPVSERCRGLQIFKEAAVQTVRATLGSQSKTLGEAVVFSSIRGFSEKAETLFDAAKTKLVQAELGITKGRDQRFGESLNGSSSGKKGPNPGGLTRRSSEGAVSNPSKLEPTESDASQEVPRRKTPRLPDLELSRKRLDLFEKLARELAFIKQTTTRFCTSEQLKQLYPNFLVWEYLDPAEITDLAGGVPFMPKAYAENITLRHFALTSRQTLKKDRQKLRRAGIK